MIRKEDEVQNYIERIRDRRSREGIPDYDACQRILEHAAEMNSSAIFGMGYYYFAEYYLRAGDREKTMHCLEECAKSFLAAKMYESLARSYNLMGVVSELQDDPVIALDHYYTGLQYAEKFGHTYVHAMIDANIGNILMYMKRYEEAIQRYEQSLDYYGRSEDCPPRAGNMVMCLICCGMCYRRLQQPEKALSLWEEIAAARQSRPDAKYPELELGIFEAECHAVRGNRTAFFRGMEEILQKLRDMENVEPVAGCLKDIAELLLDFQAYELLEEFFRIIDERGACARITREMELYPCRSACLLSQNKTREYLEYTRRYFTAYEKDRQNNRRVTARVLELRDRLSTMEREREKMQDDNRYLENIALYDSMTNLANRTSLNEHACIKFEEAQREKKLLGVELLDIDCFKKYNDTYGHLAGDACIEAVAGVLQSVGSARVFCGRYGGDEFMIVYSDMTLEEIGGVVERIEQQVRKLAFPHSASECSDIVTVSQGVFVRKPDEPNREWDFNFQADSALYLAKRAGRNCYRIKTEFSE